MEKLVIKGPTPLKGEVEINGAKNAAILATQIIGVSNENIHSKLADFKSGLKDAVMEKDAKLQDVGYENY